MCCQRRRIGLEQWLRPVSDGSCGVDPESYWYVQPISATIAATDSGTAWDSIDGSPPDVKVSMACPPSSKPDSTSTPESESYYPSWTTGGCVAQAKHLLAEPVQFKLMDVDVITGDPITANLYLQVIPQDFSYGQIVLGGSGDMNSITFSIEPY
jgi:hypothetical protein